MSASHPKVFVSYLVKELINQRADLRYEFAARLIVSGCDADGDLFGGSEDQSSTELF